MGNYSISRSLMQHSWLLVILAVAVLIVLVLPGDVRIIRRAGRVYRRWRALLWEYRAGPDTWRLRLPGVRRLQRALLRSLRSADLWRWLWEVLR